MQGEDAGLLNLDQVGDLVAHLGGDGQRAPSLPGEKGADPQDALDLPLIGKELDQSKAGWGLKRKDNLADVLSPVDGVIMEVNSKVRENPKLANHEPYGDGWLFMVRTPDVKATMGKLMTDQNSLSWMNTEVGNLEHMIEDVAGPLAADGGYLASDVYGNLPAIGWSNLTKAFLKT